MDIAEIVISSLALVACIVLIIVFTKKRNSSSNLKELGALEKQIEMLSNSINKDIEISFGKEMDRLSEKNLKINEVQNDKLERFQSNITKSINDRFDSLNQQLETKIIELNKKVDDKLKEGFTTTSETMSQVRERLQAIDAAQHNIETLSKDVVSLKNVLQNNQTRGQFGEYQLKMVLHNVFGDTEGCYKEQFTMHKTKDGDEVRADAVVFMPEPNKMICIDSKFPFADYSKMFDTENEDEKNQLCKDFSNAVKKHITVIKDKYVIEGKTAPEALMFIPNDGVFAFIHHNCQEVIEYAREKKVILTSPSTLPAILVTINMVRIETERAKNVQEINRQLHFLGNQFGSFTKEWDAFSRQLQTATKTREKLDSRVNRISNRFNSISENDTSIKIEEQEEEFDN